MRYLVIQNVDSEIAIPEGGLILWGGVSAPAEWSFETVFDDCFVLGGSYSETLQGALTHSHTNPGMASGGSHNDHIGTVAQSSNGYGGERGLASNNAYAMSPNHKHSGTVTVVGSGGAHTHTVPNTESKSNLPLYVRLRWISGGETIPIGGIVMKSAASGLPDGWVVCDGTNGTPDMRWRFVYGGTGVSGGSEKHYHESSGNTGSGGSHTHNVTIVSNEVSASKVASSFTTAHSVARTHDHTASGVGSGSSNPATHSHSVNSTSENIVHPPYVQAYYLMRKA
jgi:hypothetical protein